MKQISFGMHLDRFHYEAKSNARRKAVSSFRRVAPFKADFLIEKNFHHGPC